jgi:hypothetical protein
VATTDKLTDTAIRGAKRRAKPYKLFDGGGLHVLVRPDGKKYWRLKYYVLSVEKLISFGVYPRVTLSIARKRRQIALCGPVETRSGIKINILTEATR